MPKFNKIVNPPGSVELRRLKITPARWGLRALGFGGLPDLFGDPLVDLRPQPRPGAFSWFKGRREVAGFGSGAPVDLGADGAWPAVRP